MSSYALAGKRVWVAGHNGMVGAALMRRLQREDCTLIGADRRELDLRRQADVEAWVNQERPQAVFMAAARVGGILANSTYPADFLYDNMAMEANVIQACHQAGVEKLLFLGSSCIYPKLAPQPITEDALLTGPLEPTNEAYAIAKIAGLKLCEAYRRQHGADFISAMPTNLYGPGDNFDAQKSHVLPALIRRAHEAKLAGHRTLTIWGTGSARREFLHVDDAADALVHLMKTYSADQHVNVGCGEDLTILELTQLVLRAVGADLAVETDASKPDGTPRKLLDVRRLFATGWRPQVGLDEGVRQTYRWYVEQVTSAAPALRLSQ